MSKLREVIRDTINKTGPITVAKFMELSLGHPEFGYYTTRDPIGVKGDFVTSPEISQIFGELIALWSATCWEHMNAPKRVEVIECGPGRGTLMTDFLRTSRAIPDFDKAINIHLVETSPILKGRQSKILNEIGIKWHDSLDTVPIGPTILIANEFLDALPVHQLVKTPGGWAERRVERANKGFMFTTDKPSPKTKAKIPESLLSATTGSVYEYSSAALEVADQIVQRFKAAPGYALFIDYGYDKYQTGDTLQAVKSQSYADVLVNPGQVDLTAHVNFAALGERIRDHGMSTLGPISQASFLISLGIFRRTRDLTKNANADQARMINSGTGRLINLHQMGALYKVFVAMGTDLPTPAGFEQ
ncbi:MAG: SAM-dependent methyltransferase [Pseudomonadota bacterium]|nr:SAM-dependent methyltransferase [Pseudomonadota bacterium]